MKLAVQIIGILILAEGILFLLKPTFMCAVMAFFGKGKRLYLAAVLRITIAVIFLLAASQCKIPAIIIALGILLLVSAIVMFTVGLEKQKAFLGWWRQKPPLVLRLMAVTAILLGAVVLYSA